MCRHTVGPPSHINFVGFFDVSVQASARGNILTVIPRNPRNHPISRRAWGYEGPVLNPRVPTGSSAVTATLSLSTTPRKFQNRLAHGVFQKLLKMSIKC